MNSVQNVVGLSSYLFWSFINSFKMHFISFFIEVIYSIDMCINVFITLGYFYVLLEKDKLHKSNATSY